MARQRVFLLGVLAASSASASPWFFDHFTSGASGFWSDTYGAWVSSGGVYFATQPPNPPPLTLLPFSLKNFVIAVDVHNASDGGIWLRSDALGNNAMVLVFGGGFGGDGLYWNPRVGGVWGAGVNPGGSGVSGSDIQIRVEVQGNVYRAFLNGSSIPATTLVDSTFTNGLVGLYDNGPQVYGDWLHAQAFDNFGIWVPEPTTFTLLGTGVLALGLRRRAQSARR